MRNILIFSFIVSFYIASCSGNQSNVSRFMTTDSGFVNNTYLELIDSAGFSLLRVNGKEVRGLRLKNPCYFIKRNGEILHFSYPDVGVDNALIIAGKIEGSSLSTHPSCGNATQGLMLKKDSILFHDKVVKENYTCLNQSLDEKEFWSVAHH